MDTIAVIRKLREIELLVKNEPHPFFEKLILEALEYAIQLQHHSEEHARRESRLSPRPSLTQKPAALEPDPKASTA